MKPIIMSAYTFAMMKEMPHWSEGREQRSWTVACERAVSVGGGGGGQNGCLKNNVDALTRERERERFHDLEKMQKPQGLARADRMHQRQRQRLCYDSRKWGGLDDALREVQYSITVLLLVSTFLTKY